MYFDWDAVNLDHIALHGVSPEEVEALMYNRPLYLGPRKGEETRDVFVGKTDEGRCLVAATVTLGELIRVVTAFPASPKLERRNEGWKETRQ